MAVIESGVRESVPENTNGKIVIAYEPRWAIGAGLTPTSAEIAEALKTAEAAASEALPRFKATMPLKSCRFQM